MGDAVRDDQAGLSVRVVRSFDVLVATFPTRVDVLYSVGTINPDLAVRIGDEAHPLVAAVQAIRRAADHDDVGE